MTGGLLSRHGTARTRLLTIVKEGWPADRDPAVHELGGDTTGRGRARSAPWPAVTRLGLPSGAGRRGGGGGRVGRTLRAASPAPGPWIGLAGACFTANAALGACVAAGLVRTGGFRWIHHALYIATTTTTALATAVCALSPSRPHRAAAVALAPALLPLAALPHLGTPAQGHPRRHALAALSAAPCYVAALVRAGRPS